MIRNQKQIENDKNKSISHLDSNSVLKRNMNNLIFHIKAILFLSSLMMILWIGMLTIFRFYYASSASSTSDGLEQIYKLLIIFFVCSAIVFCLVWLAKRSFISGKGLMFIIFYSSFMVTFFMPQIETMMFNDSVQMPLWMIYSEIFSGLVACSIMSFLLVRIYSKYENNNEHFISSLWDGDKTELIWKFSLLAVIYAGFYFFFGYYIAWQFPELRFYYSGTTELKGFFEQWEYTFSQNPILPYFQIVRGFLWTSIGFFATRALKKNVKWEKYIIIGLILSIGLSFQLLIPNPYMPAPVRMGHFYETLIENFLFGVIIAIVFKQKEN